MWLLDVHTLELEEFLASNRPPYAVLSHRWGSDEVQFSDFSIKKSTKEPSPAETNTRSSAESSKVLRKQKVPVQKQGYEKVKYTCDQAKEMKLTHCWVDTACINKDSSAELSEAINSMWTWYIESSICFAYLDDVDPDRWEVTFPASKWHERGCWTLQELLAPCQVDFYSAGWKKFGTKDLKSSSVTPFMKTLSAITGIDELVLWKPAYISAKSIATRMSWASRRQTSRVEDIAYCLLGIFNIAMPLLYGEGEKAFFRLQEEIIKTSDDQSIFAWDWPQKDSGERTSGCLAKSPACFWRGDHIFTFGRMYSQSQPYLLTNQGLQINLPLVERQERPGQKYGLLNCHRENSLTDCVAIPLIALPGSSVYGRSTQDNTEEIALRVMQAGRQATAPPIFLNTSTRPQVPFAIEASLQVCDAPLQGRNGYQEVQVLRSGHESRYWNSRGQYHVFRFRWILLEKVSSKAKIILWWPHEDSRYDLWCELLCDMSRNVNDTANNFGISRVVMSLGDTDKAVFSPSSEPSGELVCVQFPLKVECSTQPVTADKDDPDDPKFTVEAILNRDTIFGNQVYSLNLQFKGDSSSAKSL